MLPNIKRVSKQLCEEANDVLYRLQKVKLHIKARESQKDTRYHLKPIDVQRFLRFQKVHVVIESYQNHLQFANGQDKEGRSLGYVLQNWIEMLVEHAQTSSPIQKII